MGGLRLGGERVREWEGGEEYHGHKNVPTYICKISPVFISSFASFHTILSLFLADSTSTTKRIIGR